MARGNAGRSGSGTGGTHRGSGQQRGRGAQQGRGPQQARSGRGAGRDQRKGQGRQSRGGRDAAAARSGSGRDYDRSSRSDLRGGVRSAGRDSDRGAGDLIEGRRAVDEALSLGLPVTRALVQVDKGALDPALAAYASRLEATGIEVERVSRGALDSLSSHGAHQGIMLKVRPYRYAELADVIAAAGEGDALVIVLDHVTDEGNFGAIVRTAEVVGAAGVVIAKARAASVGVGAYKTSAGAVMHLPIAQVSNLATALDELKAAGFWAGAATEHARDLVWDAPMGGRLALVMGSEGAGISRLVRQHCDFECRLPQRGRVESLNVAQATTALAYEWLRRTMAGEAGASAETGAADVDAAGEDAVVPDAGAFGASHGDGEFATDYFGFGDLLRE